MNRAWNQKNLDYEIETATSSERVHSSLQPTWNQKNLDYEIETRVYADALSQYSTLEIKRTSITRLKHGPPPKPAAVSDFLEIKRTSITRLKPESSPSDETSTCGLKSKEPRLRDWNFVNGFCVFGESELYLKSKEPRLRDWNQEWICSNGRWCCSWNQKNLDYEIETATSSERVHSSLQPTWNQKNLDYEIETRVYADALSQYSTLEIKRTSITRLKHGPPPKPAAVSDFLEIKRTSITRLKPESSPSDETSTCGLKSKEPRLRDWNFVNGFCVFGESELYLKSKEPRLRDWNSSTDNVDTVREQVLEIKRTSITRLKQNWLHSSPRGTHTLHLKSKEPRLRDWNNTVNILRYELYRTWNQKNLDYEIETYKCQYPSIIVPWPWNQKNLDYEIETLSISPCRASRRTWNQKNLDYEIETLHIDPLRISGTLAWNQKNLDYEIETKTLSHHRIMCSQFLEIKRTSITRLKRGGSSERVSARAAAAVVLKSKEPRLRDWNLC